MWIAGVHRLNRWEEKASAANKGRSIMVVSRAIINIGIATGKRSIFVPDVHGPEGEATLKALMRRSTVRCLRP